MMIDSVATRIWRSIDTAKGNGTDIVGIDEHMKAILRLFDLNSMEDVRVVGIWARGGNGRSALSKFVYQNICEQFQNHYFLGNLKRISQDHHMSHLRKEFRLRVQGDCSSRPEFENQRVLLVLDDVNKLEQIDALAEYFNCFGKGSLVIVTTQDRQLLTSYRINLVYEVELLRFLKVRELFKELSSRKIGKPAAFGQESLLTDDEAKLLVDGITENRSKMFSATLTNGNYLSGIDQHLNKLYPSLDLNSNEGVRVTGILGRGGSIGTSVLARHVYENILHNFEFHCFLEDVSYFSLYWHKSHLKKELYSKMQGKGLSAKTSHRFSNAIKARLRKKKILVVANEVDDTEQLAALAKEFSWFGPGSRIIITTQDRQLLSSSSVTSVYEVNVELFRSRAFKRRDEPVCLEP